MESGAETQARHHWGPRLRWGNGIARLGLGSSKRSALVSPGGFLHFAQVKARTTDLTLISCVTGVENKGVTELHPVQSRTKPYETRH